MGAMICLCFILFSQRSKLKKVKDKLQFEMQDIRNVAHMELEGNVDNGMGDEFDDMSKS